MIIHYVNYIVGDDDADDYANYAGDDDGNDYVNYVVSDDGDGNVNNVGDDYGDYNFDDDDVNIFYDNYVNVNYFKDAVNNKSNIVDDGHVGVNDYNDVVNNDGIDVFRFSVTFTVYEPWG